jgi:hypothetical protein
MLTNRRWRPSLRSRLRCKFICVFNPYSSVEPKNKAEYGQAYYNEARMANMKTGYVHPYHSDGSPIYMSNMYYMKTLFQAVGPEQVSPHYETLSRSRRGVLFFGLYIASINTISRFGGWEHNDWLRAMIWHHEFLIALYLGYIEIRHFTYFVGPKFSVFYNVYSGYEYTQIANMWADSCEMAQNQHLVHTKEQISYNHIDKEYEFVKKRALTNFLIGSKLNAEANFHNRTVAMLNQIQNFENANLKNQMREIAVGSMEEVLARLDDPAHTADIKRGSFQSALDGLRTGNMTYSGDVLLPMIETEMANRLTKFQGMSAAEESALLSLSASQKASVAENDRKLKGEFLGAAPAISHGTVKNTDAYQSYLTMVSAAK